MTSALLKTIKFTVDAALFDELGERLVGAPHIALAELIKNGYDADATRVVVELKEDRIIVSDNGHGMTFEEFQDFWMRVGTPHKQKQRVSLELKRPMTGSKGIGRLAVQFLANSIELRTVSKTNLESELTARVDWEDAVRAGEMIEAKAYYDEGNVETRFPENAGHGTVIILTGLKQDWTPVETRKLAQQVWFLQPPFRSNPNLETESQKDFSIVLKTAEREAAEEFKMQMSAAQNNWYARIVGRLSHTKSPSETRRKVEVSVQFYDDDAVIRHEYLIPSDKYMVPYCRVNAVEFEIRVYYLWGKQRAGISVIDAKEHFLKFGGVHVFDAGFHLPYYGPNTDWLGIERDHSHRLSVSQLLPDELQKGVSRGLNFLPTQGRILGVVNIDTSKERETTRRRPGKSPDNCLSISVTRDRLVDNGAYEDLKYIVRWAIDFYAVQEASRKAKEEEAQRPTESTDRTIDQFEVVLEEHEKEIPEDVYRILRAQMQKAKETSAREEEFVRAQAGLLASIATAGITAVAYEHEVGKQFVFFEQIIDDLRKIRTDDKRVRRKIDLTSQKLSTWLTQTRATRAIFSPLMDEETRETEARFKARALIEQVATQISAIARGIPIDVSQVEDDLRFPEGRFIEWSSIFQNVFLNAINAMLESKEKRVLVASRRHGRQRMILVQDTGVGVDLGTSEELFEPFVRKLELSRERRQLGLGGTGLGLTIVRLVAQGRNCRVSFVDPDKGFKTAFCLSWSETK